MALVEAMGALARKPDRARPVQAASDGEHAELVAAFNAMLAEVQARERLLAARIAAETPPDFSGRAPPRLSADDHALLRDLEHALDEDALSLLYQPQIDRDGATLTGVEALLRWTHPVRGPISPDLFIPLAERTGLIRRITAWVLDRAMRETAVLAPLPIAFNASAAEFGDPEFGGRLGELIEGHDYDPSRLEIEITETAILRHEDEVLRNMTRLQRLGVRIALDDFGAGYSSLRHLRLFPFDKLKIDKAFITSCGNDSESAAVVHAVVSIGRALGMKVVAEGVETEVQQRFLRVAGVHAMQGWLFGQPRPIADLIERVAAPPSVAAAG